MFTGINRPPIKIADNKSDSAHTNKVVEGDDISAAVLTVPLLKSDKKPKRAWRVLLDSGSDGDLVFVNKKVLKDIRHEDRFRLCKWETSNGAFLRQKLAVWI